MELATGAISLRSPENESVACWRPAETGAAQGPRLSSTFLACSGYSASVSGNRIVYKRKYSAVGSICERKAFFRNRRDWFGKFGMEVCTGYREEMSIERSRWRGCVTARASSREADVTDTSMQDAPSFSQTIRYSVRKGDTLTAIAKRYKTTVVNIAIVNDIDDVDWLQAGQVLVLPVQQEGFKRVISPITDSVKLAALESVSQQQVAHGTAASHYTANVAAEVPAYRAFPILGLAKATVPLLLIAPILGFCIRCFVDFIHVRVSEEVSRKHAEMEMYHARHLPKVKRWQGILDEDRDDSLDMVGAAAGSSVGDPWTRCGQLSQSAHSSLRDGTEEPPENETEEERTLRQKQDYEEISKSYAELEPSYMKFLADSGLSKAGYWRGGVPSTPGGDLR